VDELKRILAEDKLHNNPMCCKYMAALELQDGTELLRRGYVRRGGSSCRRGAGARGSCFPGRGAHSHFSHSLPKNEVAGAPNLE
jgi:hypothetical protein